MQTLVVLFCVVVAATAQDCGKLKKLCAHHTMCSDLPEVGKECKSVKTKGVTSEKEKQEIVDLHNQYRSRVALGQETLGNPGPQPPAANMKKLKWDDGLATVAQRWADQCIDNHDACRKDPRFPSVGQNEYHRSSSYDIPANWTRAVGKWYSEVNMYNKQTVDPFTAESTTDHYSQLVWANSEYVGCGFTGYKPDDGRNHQVYFCNYGPGGNIVMRGSSMYKVGKACSACGSRRSCDTSTGLCV